ncbi:MAG: hypothetical protein ACRC2S_25195 [Waterburya sp.]
MINELNNGATNIWSNLLQSETELNIDFQITDLPKARSLCRVGIKKKCT